MALAEVVAKEPDFSRDLFDRALIGNQGMLPSAVLLDCFRDPWAFFGWNRKPQGFNG
jgi:hypothetical protein